MHASLPHPPIHLGYSQLGWIPGLPLIAFFVLILFGRRLGRVSAWLSVAALAASCGLTMAISADVFGYGRIGIRWAWLSAINPAWTVGLVADAMSWIMLVVVTTIGTLIQLYSIGYMHDDPRFSRFFAYLSLFCASMLGLVLADHFVLLYGCWELVGLCSYLLISFWFEKPEAAHAGRKAFITTRIGDTGLLLGILLLVMHGGGLNLQQLDALRASMNPELLTWISALIFLGAVGKSAQIPLHVWLPDAMEGPTPVSALIHAATMVAAGIYLVARTLPLFTPESLQVVLLIGLATHLFAGTVALTMTDIKRILAYSTISQLGLMMTALGLAAMPQAMFHLVTHACFKALLFLGAGSVIHAMHQQDLSRLGGLWRVMPLTAGTFLIGGLALGGVFPLSGFWSKEAILLQAKEHAPWVFWGVLAGATMTAAYISRLYLRCFHGQSAPAQHGHDTHAHARPGSHSGGEAGESPPIMTGPLLVLALAASAVGFLGSPLFHQRFLEILGVHELHEHLDVGLVALSTISAALGMGLAWAVGFRRLQLVPGFAQPIIQRLYHAAANKYFVDELYERSVIQPFVTTCQRLARFDLHVIDDLVDRTGLTGWSLGQMQEWFDAYIVDRVVNGVAAAARRLGTIGRRLQTGLVHHYLLWVVAAVVIITVWVR